MQFFDCHAEFGRRNHPIPIQAERAEDLLSLYADLGIARGLVTHAAMRDSHPTLGNARVVDETRDHAALLPTWSILPPATDEQGSLDSFLAGMAANGVKVLWAYPKLSRFRLDRLSFGTLFEAMTARHIPLFVRMDQLDWDELIALLDESPGLRVVYAITGYWGDDRTFRPLLDKYANLYLTTSMYLPAEGLTSLYQRYGAERFLFGTSFPDLQPGGSVLALLHADLPDEAKAAIAGGNLERLLAEVTL